MEKEHNYSDYKANINHLLNSVNKDPKISVQKKKAQLKELMNTIDKNCKSSLVKSLENKSAKKNALASEKARFSNGSIYEVAYIEAKAELNEIESRESGRDPGVIVEETKAYHQMAKNVREHAYKNYFDQAMDQKKPEVADQVMVDAIKNGDTRFLKYAASKSNKLGPATSKLLYDKDYWAKKGSKAQYTKVVEALSSKIDKSKHQEQKPSVFKRIKDSKTVKYAKMGVAPIHGAGKRTKKAVKETNKESKVVFNKFLGALGRM